MKKVGIITMIGNDNCGNRLQNYALQEIIKSIGFESYTIKNEKILNEKNNYFINYLKYLKKRMRSIFNTKKEFKNFNKNIKFTKKLYTARSKKLNEKFDFFIVGSDQVWKPTRKRMSYMDLLGFADNNKKISYAASFGIDKIDIKAKEKLKKYLPTFKSISVRERAGKNIIQDIDKNIKVEVVLDPTLLLEASKWRSMERKPNFLGDEKYVFSYFLGDEQLQLVKIFCKKNNLKLINFYDENFKLGPSEFLYLIDNAEYIFTDSFHGTVFSIIFNKKFIVFDRKEQSINNNMISRIENILELFEIENQLYKSGDFTFDIDYKNVTKILMEQKNNSIKFLKDALIDNY